MNSYEEKVNFIVCCLSEMIAENMFTRVNDKVEATNTLVQIIEHGEFPIIWDLISDDVKDFYISAALDILDFKFDLMEQETPKIDFFVESISNDLLEISASLVFMAMEPISFAMSYEALENKIGVCRKLKGSRKWKCQLGALKGAKSSMRSALGQCRNKPNPVNCERKITKAIEKIDKTLLKVQDKLKLELQVEKQKEQLKRQKDLAKNTGIQNANFREAFNFDDDEDEDEDPLKQMKDNAIKSVKDKAEWVSQNKKKAAKTAAKVTAGGIAIGSGYKFTRSFMNARKALDVAKTTQSVANAGRAASLGLRAANLAKTGAKFAGPAIAASLISKAALSILSRKRMDVCDRTFNGSEKYKCRIKALDGSLREMKKLSASCGTDKRCKDKLNKAIMNIAKQRATAKVKFDESRMREQRM